MEEIREQIQQELNEISKKEVEIMEWYGKPPCTEKEEARLRLGELLRYRNRLLSRAEEMGFNWEPEEVSEDQVRYVLT